MNESTIWGIHAGRGGEADPLFLKKNVVALGWHELGELSNIKPDREAFKEAIAGAYPNKKPMSIAIDAGQLFRFVHEIKIGDLVVYRSKYDREVHIGRIEGNYSYIRGEDYPNRRLVKWLKSSPITSFTQGALYEIGALMAIFQIRNYADEFRAVLEGKPITQTVTNDETIGAIADDVEQNTHDFILKTLSQEMKGNPFAYFVAHLLKILGYHTRISREGPDGGVDIIAHRDELGFEPPIIKVQVKSKDGNIGDPVVSALYGKVGPNEHGLLVTLGKFTSQAESFAKSKTNLRLIDGDDLVGLILSNYEKLDSRYKGVLPLKRVYIPELIKDRED